jgi:hypothetical protein
MKEFFVKLDPRGTGYITPEAFSSFLEASRVKDSDNICRSTSRPSRSVESQTDLTEESADGRCRVLIYREEKSPAKCHVRKRRYGRF